MTKALALADWRWRYDGEISALAGALRGCDTILDLGCGSASPVAQLDGFRLFGVDGFDKSVQQARAAGKYEEVYCEDLMEFLAQQADASFDAVVALDVIEHYSREDGFRLLAEMERVSGKRTLVATPNGFMPQEPTDNPRQEHLSGWIPDDFRVRGYTVAGLYGFKWLRSRGHELRLPSSRVLAKLSQATGEMARKYPRTAAGIIAVREKFVE